jgi:hypothetical protein
MDSHVPVKTLTFEETWAKYRWLQEDIQKAKAEHEGEKETTLNNSLRGDDH